MNDAVPANQKAATKRQRYNQRPGRQAVVTVPVDGLLTPVEIAIVRVDPRSGTVELEIPINATIGHRSATPLMVDDIANGPKIQVSG